MFTSIKEYLLKINEQTTNEPVFMSKNKNNDLEYLIFRDLGNDKMQIEKGIVGGKFTTSDAPLSTWNDKIRHAKTRGYKQVSNLDVKHIGTGNSTSIPSTSTNNKTGLKATIKSTYGQNTMSKLHQHDTHGVGLILNDYVEVETDGTVKILSVDLINQYKEYLKELATYVNNNDIINFNRTLVKMNKIIKKKNKIMHYFVKTSDDLQNALNLENQIFEQYLEMSVDDFDNLEAKSIKDKIQGSKVLTTITEDSDITIEDIDANDKKQILKLLATNNEEWRFIDAFKITHHKTQEIFNNEIKKSKNKETKLLFHGSKVRNWLSIIKHGLKKSKAGTNAGTLYDNGIYFADIADKSLGYVDGGRWDNSSNVNVAYLAIYEVHTGKYADYTDIKKYERVNLETWIPSNGFDSYWAKSRNFHTTNIDGRYSLYRDEFIIYDDKKCTIKYLVEVKK